MNRWRKLTGALCLSLCLLGSLTSCGKDGDGTKLVFTTGFGKDEVFRIDNASCTTPELMVYLTTTQNQYEAVYGAEIWNTKLGDVTLEDNIKETVLAKIAQIKTMYLMAEEKKVELSEDEKARVVKAATDFFTSLNEAEISQMGVSQEIVEQLYTEYALADKVYQQIIQDINPEISDDEARTITVQHILFKTYTKDGEGKKVPVSPESKAAAYEKACEVQAKAAGGELSFEELASSNSEDSTITYSFGKGEMDKAFEEAAFRLETGEISQVIESESGYHIIKCLNTFNREETDANKLKIVEQRKKEVFGQEYDQFVSKLARNLNEKLLDNIVLIHDSQITTNDFFDVYVKYFPG